jgi:hypothetical protein
VSLLIAAANCPIYRNGLYLRQVERSSRLRGTSNGLRKARHWTTVWTWVSKTCIAHRYTSTECPSRSVACYMRKSISAYVFLHRSTSISRRFPYPSFHLVALSTKRFYSGVFAADWGSRWASRVGIEDQLLENKVCQREFGDESVYSIDGRKWEEKAHHFFQVREPLCG